jgi:hypothetical protein
MALKERYVRFGKPADTRHLRQGVLRRPAAGETHRRPGLVDDARALSLNLGKDVDHFTYKQQAMAAGKPVPTSGPGAGIGTPFTVQVSNLVRPRRHCPANAMVPPPPPILSLPPNGWTGPWDKPELF